MQELRVRNDMSDDVKVVEQKALPAGDADGADRAPSSPPPAANGNAPVKRRHRRTVLGAIVGGIWYLDARHYENTDDAFIDGHIVDVSARISGHVTKVLVDDNQLVKAGDVLVELDPSVLKTQVAAAEGDLAAALAKAKEAKTNVELIAKTAAASKQQGEAGVVVAKAAIETANAAIAQAEAQVAADEATAHKADLDLTRYENLLKTGDVTAQQVDAAVADADTAKARLEASRKGVAAAKAQLQEANARVTAAEGQLAEVNVVPERTAVSERQSDTATAQIQQLQAALEQAKLNLSYATIKAPMDGRVTRRGVEVGHYVSEGEAMMALVPTELYVTANFKETQLVNMRVGQPVTVRVDAYPDREYRGHVDSMQQGSGSRFSALPPENATGNYVKVVQRVPVKIVFDEALEGEKDFAPGMSVEPRVKVR
jgi:membrane fusion protein (multidrug efflux system)